MIISKEEFLGDKEKFVSEISGGAVFIYGTDTIYGIGCDALNSNSVLRIRELKKREEKPFSVIAPSKDWIEENCILDANALKWLEKLPGPYTFILKLRNADCVCSEVNGGSDGLGVRIPDNWFSSIVSESGVPFVTTSVNLSGEASMTGVEDCEGSILDGVDYVVDEGVLSGEASKVIDLREGEKIIR
jgi:L-threonylcarbamoyladenylate synthase